MGVDGGGFLECGELGDYRAAGGLGVPVVKVITGVFPIRVRPLVLRDFAVLVSPDSGLGGSAAVFGVVPVEGNEDGLGCVNVEVGVLGVELPSST